MARDQFPELGFYTLAGHTETPADLLDECRTADELGLGSAFISERFNVKEVASLSGAACGVTTRLAVATGVTNIQTRHPLVTAAWGATMHRLSGGRFALGVGRGFDNLFDAIGLPRTTLAALEDHAGLMRRLWHGETILGHDGPAGRYSYLALDPSFDEDIPLMLAALGPKTMALGGRVFDGVILHTFFSDAALARCVDIIRKAADDAGRDPDKVRVWAVLATLCDRSDEDLLRGLVGRMATYLQVYGDALVAVNDWDPEILRTFKQDAFVAGFRGAFDARATTDQLEHLAALIPDEWLAPSAVGSPERCALRILDQFDAGADGVILHASTPAQLESVLDAYGAVRSAMRFADRPVNPGW
jgi:5,10-methylenetetrahydromethanopterin reductase